VLCCAPFVAVPAAGNIDHDVLIVGAAEETGDQHQRQQALPILLLPSAESPRNDDSFDFRTKSRVPPG